MGGYEHGANLFRYFSHILDTAFPGNFVHQFLAVKSSFPGHFFKIGIYFQQLVVIHDSAHKTQSEQRFNSTGTSGQNAQGTRGGNGRGRGIAILDTGPFKDALTEVFKYPPLFGQATGSVMGRFLDKTHYGFGGFKRPFGVVWYFQLVEHIGKTHHAQSDFAVAVYHGGNLRQGILGHIDGVVQKPYGQGDKVFESFEIDLRSFAVFRHEFGQVDGTQVAGFQRQQRLFAAGIGAFDFPEFRRRVVAVNPIQEDNAGVTVFPGLLHQRLIYHGGI